MNLDITKNDIRIFLYKPNRQSLGEITAFLQPKQKLKAGKVNQLDFTIPYFAEKGNYKSDTNEIVQDKVKNRYFDLIRGKYSLKVEYLGKTEWYIVDDIIKTGDENGNIKQVTAFSLPYELRGERLFEWKGAYIGGIYQKEALLLSEIANNIIQKTLWTIDYIDPALTTLLRDFDFTDSTGLEALYEVAKAYGAIIVFDTENRIINFFKENNYGEDKNILFSYDKYLKSIQDEVNPSDIITRIIPVGKDGLNINTKNPTGSNYLQDFSYWMQPFQRDNERNTLQSSHWLSDDLCHALLDYNDLTQTKESEYSNLMQDFTLLETKLEENKSEVEELNEQLTSVQGQFDEKQTKGEEISEELTEMKSIESQIYTVMDESDAIEKQMSDLLVPIDKIESFLSMETNFTQTQIQELSPFINTAVWENNNLSNVNELIISCKDYFATVNYPEPVITIDLVDLFRIADIPEKLKTIYLGDKVNINYEFFDINVKSQITEMDIDYNTGAISVVIANTQNIVTNDKDELARKIYQNSTTSGAYIRSKHKLDKVDVVENSVDEFLNNKFKAAKHEITAGVNESVIINERGITITDSTDASRFLRMTNSVIAMSKDSGNTIGVAISPDGVHSEYLRGRIIAGTDLTIENSNGTFTVNGDGVTIAGGSLSIVGGLGKEHIKSTLTGVWDKAGVFNANGTLNTTYLSGYLTDDQIESAQQWNGQGTYIDDTGVYTGTVLAEQILAGSITVGYKRRLDLKNGEMESYYDDKLAMKFGQYALDFYARDGTIMGSLAPNNVLDDKANQGLSLMVKNDYFSIANNVDGLYRPSFHASVLDKATSVNGIYSATGGTKLGLYANAWHWGGSSGVSKLDQPNIELIDNSSENSVISYFGGYRNRTANSVHSTRFRNGSNSYITAIEANKDKVQLHNNTFEVNRYNSARSNYTFYVGSDNISFVPFSNAYRLAYDSNNFIRQYDTGAVEFVSNGVAKHAFYANGTKMGGSIEIDGQNLGMSPIDSPQILIEYIEFKIPLSPEGTKVYINETYLKSVDNFAVFPNRGELTKVGIDYFIISGEGYADCRIVGERVDYSGSFWGNTSSETEVDIIHEQLEEEA